MKPVVVVGPCVPPSMMDDLIAQEELIDIPANVLCWKIVKGLQLSGHEVVVISERKVRTKPASTIRRTYAVEGIRFIEHVYATNSKLKRALTIFSELKVYSGCCVLVYSLCTAFLLPAVFNSLYLKNVVMLVVPDLPQYMSDNASRVYRVLKRADSLVHRLLLKRVHGIILLTRFMAEKLKLRRGAGVLVMEGIADCECLGDDSRKRGCPKPSPEYILYAGNMSSRYGVPKLIDAFHKANLGDVRLVLCGSGDYANHLLNSCGDKVVYLGQIGRSEVIDLEKSAQLLVNPRSREDEYTRYSFPSKTIEYLASGVPLMMERLSGIPEEYYEYIYEVEGEDWTQALVDYFRIPLAEREDRGQNAAAFIAEHKSIDEQGRRLSDFVETTG